MSDFTEFLNSWHLRARNFDFRSDRGRVNPAAAGIRPWRAQTLRERHRVLIFKGLFLMNKSLLLKIMASGS